MKAISIQQPWAWAIFNAGKDIENRTWKTNFRGKILIHAGKKIDGPAYHTLKHEYGLLVPEDGNLITGCIVGSVEIVDCVTQSDSKWFTGPYGFVLKNPIQFETPVPLIGQLGIFESGIGSGSINV